MNIGGICDAIETSVCRMNPDTGKASVVTEYHYKQCCSDINGIEINKRHFKKNDKFDRSTKTH